MKIMLLAGGNSIHTVRWANKLCENGNEVHLCFVSNQEPSIDKFNIGVKLHKLHFPAPYGYYLNSLELRKLISKIQPDILNAHYASGYGTLGRLTRFSPYLISVYGGDVYSFPYLSATNMKIIRKNLKSADSIASTSYAMALQTTKLMGIDVNDIYITPFGVDINEFSKKKVEKDFILIGTIKTLAPKYGLEYGIRAIDYLVKNLIDSPDIIKKLNIIFMVMDL